MCARRTTGLGANPARLRLRRTWSGGLCCGSPRVRCPAGSRRPSERVDFSSATRWAIAFFLICVWCDVFCQSFPLKIECLTACQRDPILDLRTYAVGGQRHPLRATYPRHTRTRLGHSDATPAVTSINQQRPTFDVCFYLDLGRRRHRAPLPLRHYTLPHKIRLRVFNQRKKDE